MNNNSPMTPGSATTMVTTSSTSALASSASFSSSATALATATLGSLSGSTDPTKLLDTCMTTILEYDAGYALCVMNSGFFEAGSPTFSTSSISALLGSGSTSAASVDFVGTCELMCTDPTMAASSSCCDAADTVMNCKSSSSSISYCKSVIEDTAAASQSCGISGANMALIVCCAVIVVVFATVMVLARLQAKRQASRDSSDALESRFAAATRAKWESVLAAWRQVTNLIWKNLIIRRRKPVSFLFELLLPVILVVALVFIANLDNIFGTGNYYSSSSSTSNSEASTSTNTIVCSSLESLEGEDIGTLSTNMSTFYSSGQSVIGLFLLISYIKFVSTTTTTMVIEKETRIREVMKIMGLSNFTLLASWCLTTVVLSTPLAFVVAAELKYGHVFPMTEYATIVFLLWTLSLSIVSFSYFITPFFNKSRAASIASVLLWLVLFFPFFSVMSKSNSSKYWGALAPPTAFALGVDDMMRHAQLGRGLAYAVGKLESPITVPSAFEMSWFLILDSVILVALGWYFDNVLPQEYGIPKPWNFVFLKEYWVASSPASNDKEIMVMESPSTAQSPQGDYTFASPRGMHVLHQASSDGSIVMLKEKTGLTVAVEPVNATLADQERKGTCLQIQGLRKEFSGDDGEVKVAVQQLNLTLYSGQITALLGHNGAGKTTTISMLTGLTTPTAGDATLYGRSMRCNFNELRQIMGICPQHDVLFNELTVEEHLRLFGTMKHVAPASLDEVVERMIREVGLVEKRKVTAKNLSGGQKRKLGVALAFVGDSKLVFLDEPTSGMDPYSRRFTWNLLQRNRDDRVIVLTTHFMDEADILGDRIAIMADGQLCCAGSSLFLKNRYGAGYNLTMIKAPGCDVEKVGDFLRGFVPEAKCLSNFGSEAVFQLPSSSAGVFSTMLQVLDTEMHHLRVVQYGVSVTTLEEVFLRIAHDREEEGRLEGCGVETVDQIRKTSATSANSRGTSSGGIASTKTERTAVWTQYTALLTKRLRIAKRDKKNLLNAVCIPLLFLIILAALPEINVASFMSSYDYTADLATGTCLSTYTNAVTVSVDMCKTYGFDYCSLGVIDCDAATCCDKTDVESPWYACNTCQDSTSSNPITPCYNSYCLDKDGAKLQATLNAFLTAIVVMLAFAFVPAAIVAFIVREKNPSQNAKSLQLICGANVSAYWLSTWTHDIAIMIVSVIAAIIIVPLSDRTLRSTSEVWGVVALVASHALAVIPMAYLFSFRFNKHAVAQTSLLVFALCTGGILSIFSFLCRLIDFNLTSNSMEPFTLSQLDRNYLRWIFMSFPGYSLNNGIYEIATRKLSRSALYGSSPDSAPPSFFGVWEGLGTDTDCISCWESNTSDCCVRNVFDLDVAGAPVVYAVVEIVVFMVLVFVVDSRRLSWNPERRFTGQRNDDDDVARERQKVGSSYPSANDSVFIRNLHQQYGGGGKVALDNLCLSIPKGECFGYLGINGAGKSTTMKVLTGEIAPTNGFVTLGGYDLSQHRDKARRVIGYCPQFDALHDLLTVEEQLELYARLKGIRHKDVKVAVDQKIEEVGLTEYRSKLTRGLSGGNKRKLSTAIALMGSPCIIFLDEPSTGVDPSSRRKMWDVIASVCASKESCVVLTTHSMEECEALCTRVGILVSGRLKCLGSVEHLKQKFGRGYIVEVKLREPKVSAVTSLQLEVYRALGGDATDVTLDRVISLCSSLGVPSRAHEIMNGEGNGGVLKSYLDTLGAIPIDEFSVWWYSETLGSALSEFFANRLPGSHLVERQGDHFRFQVPKQSLRPFAIFGLLEENKEQLQVREYGVSETSLEHIFNNMASQQVEEQMPGSARYNGAW